MGTRVPCPLSYGLKNHYYVSSTFTLLALSTTLLALSTTTSITATDTDLTTSSPLLDTA